MGAQSSTPLRILGSRAKALGSGDSESLQNVDTTILPDGTVCWVTDTETLYVLDHQAAGGGSNITPDSGPGIWTPVTGGGGGGIPMPDGSVNNPRGANFINELTLGLYRPAAGLMGLAQGGFLGLQMGNGTVTNVDPNSPSVVRYVVRGFNRPLQGTENETAFAYVRIDPSNADPQQAALYVDITDKQLDTFGPAIKVVHAGHGDAIYVAQFNNGSAYEAASFADGTRGYISTIQVAGTPNSTLFNALWDSASVPNFGMYYADLATANALTIRKRAATAVAGLTQIRLIEQTGEQRFGLFNDGAVALEALPATVGSPNHESPEFRLFSESWDGAASSSNEWLAKVIPTSPTASTLRLYQITSSGTVLVAQFSNDGATPGSNFLDLQGGTLANATNVQSAGNLGLYTAGNLGLQIDVPPGANDTAMGVLLVRDHAATPVNKAVTQGQADSGGVGFRSLVVPNDVGDDTAVDADDFVLNGWAGGSTVTVAAGSTCRRGSVTVNNAVGAAPGWTIDLTFPEAFAATPFAIAQRNDANNPPNTTSMSVRVSSCTTTHLIMAEDGTSAPIDNTSYIFTWIVME